MTSKAINDKNIGLTVAAVLFLAAAIVQIIRLVTHFSVVLNGTNVPLTVNVIGLIVYVALSFWFFKLRREA